MPIKPFKPTNAPTRISFLVYGPSGSGKTYATSTLPEPIGLINTTPGGYNTVIRSGKDIEVIDLTDPSVTYADIKNLFLNLRAGRMWADKQSVVLDEVTGLMSILMDMILTSRAKFVGSSTPIPIGDFGEPHRSHYAVEASTTYRLLQRLLNSPIPYRVANAHERIYYNKDGAIIAITPLFRGTDKGALSRLFDEAYYLKVMRQLKGGERVESREFQCRPSGVIDVAKSRIASLIGQPDRPTYPANYSEIINLLKEN